MKTYWILLNVKNTGLKFWWLICKTIEYRYIKQDSRVVFYLTSFKLEMEPVAPIYYLYIGNSEMSGQIKVMVYYAKLW